jgi:hypothetical protein
LSRTGWQSCVRLQSGPLAAHALQLVHLRLDVAQLVAQLLHLLL